MATRCSIGRRRSSRESRQLSRLKYSRLTIRRKAKDDAVVGLLSLFDPLGFLERGPDLVAYYREARAARAAGSALAAAKVRHELVTDLAEEDPLEAYRAASRPFPVGKRFWIDPGEVSDSPAPPGRIALALPASCAFGTGQHESTQLALLALEEEPLEGRRLLDVGTGSGIVALAAAALGASLAVAFDSDPEAIFLARENVRRHAFGARVVLAACTPDALAGTFPIVVANLLPEELLPMRAAIFARVASKGRLIVSGIPTEQEGEVVTKLRTRRWALSGCRRENGWTCVILEHG
ncbi:MAG TPA: 50S ribosomal protein L11 methyltransferase [Thermoanaerobaculia bacterium]